jgi:RNA polymerase sigma-70 factor, ECF subfamily
MNLKNEKELIKKAQKDPQVFAELYNEYYPEIFNYILKRAANLEVTQDITSETFFKALKNLWQFRWRNISIAAWLYRCANHEIATFYRKNRSIVSMENLRDGGKNIEPAALYDPETDFLEAQEKLNQHKDFLQIHEKISKLDVKYQEVIVLRFFEKKKIIEICKILNKKEGTIKSLLHRGLEQLRDLIQ